jgi:hypothetical protein
MHRRNRAFIVADAPNPTNRLIWFHIIAGRSALCVSEAGTYCRLTTPTCYHFDASSHGALRRSFGSSSSRRSVVSKLSGPFPGVYSDGNVAIVSTHRRAGAADTPRTLSNNHTVWLLPLKQRTLPCWVPCSLCGAHIQALRLALSHLGTLLSRPERIPELNITPIKTGQTLLRFADASGAVSFFFAIQYFVRGKPVLGWHNTGRLLLEE